MWERLLLINLLLAGVLVAGVAKIRRNWFEFEASHRVEAVQAEPEAARTIPVISDSSVRPGDWTEIPTKSLFSFDRSDIAILMPKEVPPPPGPPKPLLFGTMSIGGESIAMLAPGQGRPSRPIKIGESIENWQLVEIQQDSVVMTANGNRATIGLNNGPRDHSRTAGSSAPTQAATPAAVVPSLPSPTPSTANSPTAAPSLPTAPPPGETKGHWIYTPFGPKWVSENP